MLAGLDEAGRGPLAGPVCAAAVILPEGFPLELLGDSKALSRAARERAAREIYRSSAFWAERGAGGARSAGGALWGIGWATHREIDAYNILQASLLAMRRAFLSLAQDPRFSALAGAGISAVADGKFAPELPVPCRAVVKADALVPEVMAASILAKTWRDWLMERYALVLPEYGYEKHKGYPTKFHREMIARHGVSPIQRLSFRWH